MRTMVVVVLLIASILTSQMAAAFCGLGHRSVRQEYDESDWVFVGDVISQQATPESNGYEPGITYTLAVDEMLEGERTPTIRVFSENSSGRFPMEAGRKYLLFVGGNIDRLEVDNCGNSGPITERAKALKTVRHFKTARKLTDRTPQQQRSP